MATVAPKGEWRAFGYVFSIALLFKHFFIPEFRISQPFEDPPLVECSLYLKILCCLKAQTIPYHALYLPYAIETKMKMPGSLGNSIGVRFRLHRLQRLAAYHRLQRLHTLHPPFHSLKLLAARLQRLQRLQSLQMLQKQKEKEKKNSCSSKTCILCSRASYLYIHLSRPWNVSRISALGCICIYARCKHWRLTLVQLCCFGTIACNF